jgi:D-amino-acid dehydrogenase
VTSDPDVLVVGGGVVGLFCAYHLRLAGARVTVLERGPVGGPQSCSSGNTGFVGTHGAHLPVLLDLKRQSLAILRSLDAVAVPGMIIAYRTAEGFSQARQALPALVARGIPMRVLDPAELPALEPGLEFDVRGATYNEEGAHLRLPEFLYSFAKLLQDLGAELHPDTEALDFEVAGGTVRRVRTTRGELRPAELLLASGAWTARLAAKLGLRLPLEPVKGHAVTLHWPVSPPEPDHAVAADPAPGDPAPRDPVAWGVPQRPVTLGEAVLALAPTGDGFRLGGGRERVGFEGTVSSRLVDGMLRTVREYLPSLGAVRPAEAWTGFRPTTPDGVPYIGRAPGYRNLFIACGHDHIGMGLAPAGGRLLAQLLTGERPDVDPAPFRVDRFGPT